MEYAFDMILNVLIYDFTRPDEKIAQPLCSFARYNMYT